VSSSRIAAIGPSSSPPSPAVQAQSVALNRTLPSLRRARNGNRSGQTRSAAAIAAWAGLGRVRPSGSAMSCPCTSTSMSGSRWLTPGAFRRDPAIARSRGAYSRTGSRACRRAVSRTIRLKFPRARASATAAGNAPIWDSVRCAATSRTRQPAHSDGVSHSCSDPYR
jgi:hypothetical protein